MTLLEVNRCIQEAIIRESGGGRRKHTMLRYSLDLNFEVAALANEIEENEDLRMELSTYPQRYVLLIGCIWILKFYRDANGMDYKQTIMQLLGWSNTDYNKFTLRDSNFRRTWRIGRDNTLLLQNQLTLNSEEFHTECWMLKADQAGATSKITRGMKFLLQILRPDFTEGEFYAAIEQLENTAVASRGQIKAAELYEEDFIAVLRTLQTGDGVGWLTEFNDHPLRMAVARCEWGLLENGGIRTIALRVVGRNTVSVVQGHTSYEKKAHRCYATFTWDELRKAGIDPKVQLVAGGIKMAPVDVKDVILIRVSRKDLFHRFIPAERKKSDKNELDEIQAVELWALTKSPESDAFTLGECSLVTSSSRLTEPLELYLHKLDLRELDRSNPIPLSFRGKPLLKVGAAPWLFPASGEPEFQFHQDPETWLVFGEETELKLGDFTGTRTDLDPRNVQNRNGRIFLTYESYGKKATASVLLPGRGYRLRVSVVFLPPEMRESMLSENSYCKDGISWEPQTDSEILRPRVKGTGLCPGLLTVNGNESVKVSVPSGKVHFWIREGLSTDRCYDTPLVGAEEILQKALTVECYLPPGENVVTWGGIVSFTTEEAGYYSFGLKGYHTPAHSGEAAGLRVRTRAGEEIEILRIPRSPSVEVRNTICLITFPATFNAEDWDCCLVAEGTLGGQLGGIVRLGCCADLVSEPQENDDWRILDIGHLHPDEGASLVLYARGEHGLTEDPEAFFCRYLAAKPTDNFYGPFTVQDSNPFRTQVSFSEEYQDRTFNPILLPDWMRLDWGHRSTIEVQVSVGIPDGFLAGDFTLQTLDSELSDSLCSGKNWLAYESWGGSKLFGLLDEVENNYAFSESGSIRRGKPTFSWEKIASCGFLAGFPEIMKGKRPNEVWLPLEFVGFEHRSYGHGHHQVLILSKRQCSLNDAPNIKRSLRFDYGGQVRLRYSDLHEFMDLCWVADTALVDGALVPNWWPQLGIGEIASKPNWFSGWKSLNCIYYNQIKEAHKLVGRGTEGTLSHLLHHLIGWMKISEYSKERCMIFQAAVLCRIHAWLGNGFGDKRSKEIISVFVAEVWRDPAARKILKNDILTVDWMLAWLHAHDFNVADN